MNLIPWRKKRESNSDGTSREQSMLPLRREVGNLFDRFFRDPWGVSDLDDVVPALARMPRTDLLDSENEITLTLELPGVGPKDVDIEVTGDMLTVRGEKKHEREDRNKSYHYVERQFGAFCRSVPLPKTVDTDKVDASFNDGVLTLRIPKRPDAKPRKVKVRNA